MLSSSNSIHLITILFVVLINILFTTSDQTLVETSSGKLKGISFYLDKNFNLANKSWWPFRRRIDAWLGVPYAEKPLGNLRFKRPVRVKKQVSKVIDATSMPNTCFQQRDTLFPNFEGAEQWNPNTAVSEDCLYLNIWKPSLPLSLKKKIPVLVWIYGGGFATGTSTLNVYDPKILVSETELIFVSIQYRLNIFGFMYLNETNASGNMGLFDQRLALEWVYSNIEKFGGDKTRITIFGESAGAASVNFHLISPQSWPLFNNAILQSGAALAPWALIENKTLALERNTNIVNYIGCNQTIAREKIDCLNKMDAQTLLSKADEYFYSQANQGILQFTFLPVVDGLFLTDTPRNLLNRGTIKKCPLLMGVNENEANYWYVYAFENYRNLSMKPIIDNALFKSHLTNLFHFYPQFPLTSTQQIQDKILAKYSNNGFENFDNLDSAGGDFNFRCPQIQLANIYESRKENVYFYYFTEMSDKFYWPEWLGVLHGNEIPFVFGAPLNTSKKYDEAPKVLARKMLRYWSNFVRYNQPNSLRTNLFELTPTLWQPIEYWPRFNLNNAYLVLNSTVQKANLIGHNLRAEYCSFWYELF